MRSTLVGPSWKCILWLMMGALLFVTPGHGEAVSGPEYVLHADAYSLSRDEAGLTRIHMPGYNPAERPGAVALPGRVHYFLLPLGVRPETVTLEILAVDWVDLDGTFRIPVTVADT
ncbi:MAG: hypothetical protein JXQ27_04360, partial [Acidobacteria bacterium]|nr:hypothetical protein [Acidobacteriota bacterium]